MSEISCSSTPTAGSSAACKLTTSQPPSKYSWSEDEYSDKKTELLKYVVNEGHWAPIPRVVESVFDEDTESDGSNAQLARRFFNNHDELFEITDMGHCDWVEAKAGAFYLISTKHGARKGQKTKDCGGMEEKANSEPRSPKEVAKAVLSERSTIDSDRTRSRLLHSLATRREQTEGATVLLQNNVDTERYLALPYETRFNSSRRVATDVYEHVWETAGKRYDTGVMVTLTTDPKRFESILDATDDLFDDIGLLRQWLAYEPKSGHSRLGRRVPTVVVPEFTDTGLIHAHIVFFDTNWVAHWGEIKDYWEKRNRGKVIDFSPINHRDGVWLWADESKGRRPKQYLGKTLSDLYQLSQTRPDAIRGAAQKLREGSEQASETTEWWKLALYWATGMRLFTASPTLKPDSSDDETPYLSRWSFVGIATVTEIPPTIMDNLVTYPSMPKRRPPPGDDG